MIKAILEKGIIRPVEPLPLDWRDGQELVVEADVATDPTDIDRWAEQLEAAARAIPAEEHERFLRALEEGEKESKDAVRRAWGLG
jgi:predicted DNA-binding antitoxin AbrB/MazE fold protein